MTSIWLAVILGTLAAPQAAPLPQADISAAPVLLPLAAADLERMGLLGAGCTWAGKAQPDTMLFAAKDSAAGVQIAGRFIKMRPDPVSPPLPHGAYDVRSAYDGSGFRIELDGVDRAWQGDGEATIRTAAANLTVMAADGSRTPLGPGTLTCGS